MTSTTAFVLLVLVLLAVLARQEFRRRAAGSPSLRVRLSGSGPTDPDARRQQHDLRAIAAHSQAPFVR